MKKVFLATCLVLSIVSTVNLFAEELQPDTETQDNVIYTDQIQYDTSAINKFGRGAINVATCWAEVPAKILEVTAKKDAFQGLTVGLVEGTITALVRGVGGLFDAGSCLEAPYDKPKMEPEFAYNNFDKTFREYLW